MYEFSEGLNLGKNYRIVEFLGQGWEGEVYKIEEKDTGAIRAAKFFYFRDNHRQELIRYARKLVRLGRCPIIIHYLYRDVLYHKKQKIDYLVSDYIDGEVLSNFLEQHKRPKLGIYELLHIFYAIVKGIEQVHMLGEYHGDIHSDNIMIRRKGLEFEVHLIDLMDTGKPNKRKTEEDVYDLIMLLYEILGGARTYSNSPKYVKQLILGKRKDKVRKKFKTASDVRRYLDALDWSEV